MIPAANRAPSLRLVFLQNPLIHRHCRLPPARCSWLVLVSRCLGMCLAWGILTWVPILVNKQDKQTASLTWSDITPVIQYACQLMHVHNCTVRIPALSVGRPWAMHVHSFSRPSHTFVTQYAWRRLDRRSCMSTGSVLARSWPWLALSLGPVSALACSQS